MTAIKVIIQSEDLKVCEDFLEYDQITLSEEDPTLNRIVDETRLKISADLIDPEVSLRITYIWQKALKDLDGS